MKNLVEFLGRLSPCVDPCYIITTSLSDAQGSILVLFVLSLLCVGGRFYTKLRIRKQRLGYDDAFILFGTCCMVCSVGLLYAYIDSMYLVEALLFGVQDPTFIPPADAIKQSFYFQRMVAASLVLSWITITCVKFSFLALFRSLIDRLPPMLLYWKIVVVFNALICIYSALVYLVVCPYFGNLKACKSWSCVKRCEVDRLQCPSKLLVRPGRA